MKTKHILTAMVLPTLLAACTADEIVENNNNNLVAQGRAEVEAVSFAINGEGSRLAYNDDNLGWDWEDTDKFLLFPADNGNAPYVGTKANPAYPGQRFAVGNNLVTGYEYEKGADGAYTTKAAVMGEGLYWGYAPSFNKTARGLIGFDLATSQDVEYYKSEAAQAFVTPLYEVNAEIYNNKLPLEMINWYTTAIFPLKNNTKQDLNLKQIVVNANKAFQVKGEIDINAMGAYIMAYDGEEWDAVQNYDKNPDNNLNLKKGEFIDGFRKLYMTKAGEEGVTSNILLLNLEGEVLEAGETKTYYMLLPATSDKISCDIIVMAEEGYVEIESTSQSNYLKNTQIYHNGQKAAFGWQTVKGENIAKPYVIKSSELNENENDVYYVASYDDLMNLINNVNGTFEAYNVGDWSVDAAMAEAITDSDSEVIFRGNVIVDDASAKEIEFNKVTFRANVTIKEGNKVTFVEDVNDTTNKQWGTVTIEEDAELIVEDCNLGGTIEVEDGAKLTVNKNANAYAYVVNKGEVTLEEQPNVTVYQEGGILNLNKHAKTAAGKIEYSTEYIKFPADVTFETIVADGVEFIVDEAIVLDRNDDEGTKATLTVNGDLTLNADVTILGEMTVEGTTDDVNGDLTVKAGGLLTNNGNARNADIIVEKDAEFRNNGVARDVYNYGLVIAGKDSKTTIVDGDKTARVDNTLGGAVTNTAEQVVFYTLPDGDVDDIEDVDFADWSINTLRIEGTLDMEPFSDDADWEQLKTLRTLELANSAIINVEGAVNVNFDKVIIEGNAKISGYRYETSSLTFDADVKVFMTNKSVSSSSSNSCYTLTIEDVTVDAETGKTIKFSTVDEIAVTDHKKYNKPVVETEEASLIAEIDNTEIEINGDGVNQIDVIGTLAELKAALSANQSVINLHKSVINLDEQLTIDRSVTIYGGTLVGKTVKVTATTGEVKFSGVTFKNAANAESNASSLLCQNLDTKLTVVGCTFDGFEWDAIQITNITANANINVEGNTFKSPVSASAIESGSYVHIASKNVTAGKIRIVNNTFGSKRAKTSSKESDYMVKVYGFNSGSVIVGENEYLSGYQNNCVMMYRAANYGTDDKIEQIWTNRDMYNVMIGEKTKLSDVKADLDESHTQPENL